MGINFFTIIDWMLWAIPVWFVFVGVLRFTYDKKKGLTETDDRNIVLFAVFIVAGAIYGFLLGDHSKPTEWPKNDEKKQIQELTKRLDTIENKNNDFFSMQPPKVDVSCSPVGGRK